MIVWLLADSAEVPPDDVWLAPAERAALEGLAQRPKRRADWRLGRWVAKRAMGMLLGSPPADIEIRTRPDGAPFACCAGVTVEGSLSISHRDGLGLCIAAEPPLALGCDLELVERRAAVFKDDWFTAAERQRVASADERDHDWLITLIWSAKESALKALGTGLRRDTRTVAVDSIGSATVEGWRTLRVSDLGGGATLEGWWRRAGRFVISVVGTSMPLPPCPAGRGDAL